MLRDRTQNRQRTTDDCSQETELIISSGSPKPNENREGFTLGHREPGKGLSANRRTSTKIMGRKAKLTYFTFK